MTDSMVSEPGGVVLNRLTAEEYPTSRALVVSFGRGVIHGLRPGGSFTWCGRRHPEPGRASLTSAAAITCGQCQRRGEVSRGHTELISWPVVSDA